MDGYFKRGQILVQLSNFYLKKKNIQSVQIKLPNILIYIFFQNPFSKSLSNRKQKLIVINVIINIDFRNCIDAQQ